MASKARAENELIRGYLFRQWKASPGLAAALSEACVIPDELSRLPGLTRPWDTPSAYRDGSRRFFKDQRTANGVVALRGA